MELKNKRTWFLTAMIAPAVQAASGCSWLTSAVLGILCLLICWGIERINTPQYGWLQVVQCFWIILIIGTVLKWTLLCWKTDSLFIPSIILCLAAWTVNGGDGNGMRVGLLLRWLVMLLIFSVFFSGLWDIQIDNLKPVFGIRENKIITVLTLPVLALRFGGRGIGTKVGLLALVVFSSFIVNGVLSFAFVKLLDSPFYEFGKSVRVFGIAERFESLVSVGMTLGYYVFLCWGFALCKEMSKSFLNKESPAFIWIITGAILAASLFSNHITEIFVNFGTVLLFVILPVITGCLEYIVKRKNA